MAEPCWHHYDHVSDDEFDNYDYANNRYVALSPWVHDDVTNLSKEDAAIVGQVLKNLICKQLMYLFSFLSEA